MPEVSPELRTGVSSEIRSCIPPHRARHGSAMVSDRLRVTLHSGYVTGTGAPSARLKGASPLCPDVARPFCEVIVDPTSACGRCSGDAFGNEGSVGGCGIRLFASRPLQILCENSVGAQPGDRVRIDTGPEPAGWLAWVALAYGLPALSLLVGAALGDLLATSFMSGASSVRDLAAATGALAGLSGGLFTGRRASRVLVSPNEDKSAARVVAILPLSPGSHRVAVPAPRQRQRIR